MLLCQAAQRHHPAQVFQARTAFGASCLNHLTLEAATLKGATRRAASVFRRSASRIQPARSACICFLNAGPVLLGNEWNVSGARATGTGLRDGVVLPRAESLRADMAAAGVFM